MPANFVEAHAPRRKTRLTAVLTATGLVASLGLLGGGAAQAVPATNDLNIDFSGYATGGNSPAGQSGWTGGTGYDWELVDNADFVASGMGSGVSLRFSNAVANGVMTQLGSPQIDSAGESSVAGKNTFEAAFTIASATGGTQSGLNVDVAVDNGAASRAGGVVNFRHTDRGLEIGSYWVPENAKGGALEDWASKVFTTVPANVPHSIGIKVTFVDGAADTFDLTVDGVLVATSTTWEFYHTSGKQTVNSLLFRTSRSAPTADGIGYATVDPDDASTLDGKGFLFNDISYRSYAGAQPAADPPAASDLPAAGSGFTPTGDTAASGLNALDATKPLSGEMDWTNDEDLWVDVYAYSTPIFLGTFPVVNGKVVLTGIDLSALEVGGHRLVFIGQTSESVQVVAISIKALAVTGSETGVPLAIGSLSLLMLGAFLVLRNRQVLRRNG